MSSDAGLSLVPQNASKERAHMPRLSKRLICKRPGCVSRSRKPTSDHCSFVCSAIHRELDKAARVRAALGGDVSQAEELYAQAVRVNDEFSRLRQLNSKLFSHAKSVGFTSEEWRQIEYGTPNR